MHAFRIFTLQEANRLIGPISERTQQTQERLDELRDAYREGSQSDVEAEIRSVLDAWAQAVLALGAQPKGIFTVDFRSPDPNVLWCWAPEESTICHRHFTWESFKDRVPIDPDQGFWPSHN